MQPTTSPIVQAANNVKSEPHVVFDDGTWPSDRSLGGLSFCSRCAAPAGFKFTVEICC